MLDTVRMPSAVPISPDTAALKAVLVKARILVVIRARKLAVSSRHFVQVIMIECFPSFWSTSLRLVYPELVFDKDLREAGHMMVSLESLSLEK